MRYLLIIFAGMFLIACNESSELPIPERSSDYYPMAAGQFRTYEVVEINFTLLAPDTSRYFLREVIEDSLVSGDGSVKYLLSRYVSIDNQTFELDSVWSSQMVRGSVLVTENNLTLVKLVDPVAEGTVWNGNAYNARPELIFYYQNAVSDDLFNADFGDKKLIKVVLEDIAANVVGQDERSEIYAEGIGLVQKNYVTLSFCTLDCGEIGEIQSGRILKQTLLEYGTL